MKKKTLKNILLLGALFGGFLLTSSGNSSYMISRNSSYLNSFVNKEEEFLILLEENKSINDFKLEFNNFNSKFNLNLKYELKDTIKGIGNYLVIKGDSTLYDYLSYFETVSSYSINDSYNIEKTYYDNEKTFYEPLENNSKKELNIPENSHKGEGVVAAVLDTSFNIDHEVFQSLDSSIYARLEKSDIDSIIKQEEFVADLEGMNYYKNNKIPYYHNYGGEFIDEENNVESDELNNPYTYHGTHVASLLGANGEFEGIAPNCQLVLMGVSAVSDSDYFIYDDYILRAFNDCYLLDVDLINCSFGGAVNDIYNDPVLAETLSRIQENGTIVSFAAGNTGRDSYANIGAGEFSSTENIESGVLSDETLNPGVVGVGSSIIFDDDMALSELSVGDNFIYGVDQLTHLSSQQVKLPFHTLIKENEIISSYEYVVVPGLGAISDYEGLDVEGKICVILRGELSFAEKINNAYQKGAVGVIIGNNPGGGSLAYFDFSSGPSGATKIPSYCVSNETYNLLTNEQNKIINVSKSSVSSFSSTGPLSNLELGVDIVSPGENAAGAVNIEGTRVPDANYLNDAYKYVSGTSMASPNFVGSLAVLLSEEEAFNSENGDESKKQEIVDKLVSKVMTNANVLTGSNGTFYSPRKQGAGLVDVDATLNSNIYLTYGEKHEGKVELKNNDDIKNGDIKFDVTLHNESKEKHSYKATLYVMAPEVVLMDSENNPTLKGKYAKSTNDILLEAYTFDVELTGEKEQVISIDHSLSQKSKEYYEKYFGKYGTYLEGYLILEPNDELGLNEISIPYFGFHGDYNKKSAIEDFTFEREENIAYESDIIDTLLNGLTYYAGTAETSSYIKTTTKDSLSETIIEDSLGGFANINDYHTDIKSGGKNNDYLYAGIDGVSDTLVIKTFIDRSALDNRVTIKDSSGNTLLDSYLANYVEYADTSSLGQDIHPLYKSFPDSGYISYFGGNQGYIIIGLKSSELNAGIDEELFNYHTLNLENGEYTLQFDTTLSTNEVVSKTYHLMIVDKIDAPEVVNFDLTNLGNSSLTFKGNIDSLSVNGVVATKETLNLEDGTTQSKFSLDLSSYENNDASLYVEVTFNYIIYKGLISSDLSLLVLNDSLKEGYTLNYSKESYFIEDTFAEVFGVDNSKETNVYRISVSDEDGDLVSNFAADFVISLRLDDSYTYCEVDSYILTNLGGLNPLTVSRDGNTLNIQISNPRSLDVLVIKSSISMMAYLPYILIGAGVLVVVVVAVTVITITIKKKKEQKNSE